LRVARLMTVATKSFRLCRTVESALKPEGGTGMRYYAGLDVSLMETSICVVDERRRVETIGAWLLGTGLDLELVGLEAGSLAPALF